MWFLFALLTVLAWGTADMFYKLGNESDDRESHLKTVTAVGLVMGVHALIFWALHPETVLDLATVIKYLPISLAYIISMAIGYFGLRFLYLSVSSPVQNSSGAFAALLCFAFFSRKPETTELIGILLVSAGIIALAVFERRENSVIIKKADKKYVFGLTAVIFPILYCIFDALGTFLDAYYLDEKQMITENQALIAYELTFLACGAVALLITLNRNRKTGKKLIAPTKKTAIRFLAAGFETAGQFFYVFAMAKNGMVAAPMVSAYCIVSLILSRLVLKEKLQPKKYAVIAAVIIGIILLGIE